MKMVLVKGLSFILNQSYEHASEVKVNMNDLYHCDCVHKGPPLTSSLQYCDIATLQIL